MAETSSLLRNHTCKRIEGSNPSFTAIYSVVIKSNNAEIGVNDFFSIKFKNNLNLTKKDVDTSEIIYIMTNLIY